MSLIKDSTELRPLYWILLLRLLMFCLCGTDVLLPDSTISSLLPLLLTSFLSIVIFAKVVLVIFSFVSKFHFPISAVNSYSLYLFSCWLSVVRAKYLWFCWSGFEVHLLFVPVKQVFGKGIRGLRLWLEQGDELGNYHFIHFEKVYFQRITGYNWQLLFIQGVILLLCLKVLCLSN